MCQTMKESFRQSQSQIRFVKETFTRELAEALDLLEIQAPLLSEVGSGIQDDLNGSERPVAVDVGVIPDRKFEVVQSLAKWKRMILGQYGFQPGEGIFTHLKALRPDEDVLGPMHSVYVDQWDWEKVITAEIRTLDTLKDTVRTIYTAIRATAAKVKAEFGTGPELPETITFLHSEDLLEKYPDLSPRERETAACKEYGAIFVIGIGAELADGQKHDGRAPDYDDWTSETSEGHRGLNGDIIVWNPVLDRGFELSSMGIRVDVEALRRQLAMCDVADRESLTFHQRLLTGELPLSIGGGIGQSRLTMFMLKKRHIGQVQFSVWPSEQSVETLTFEPAMAVTA